MSKSMNKYHKCMSELGNPLSGWVKVGAIALGVGVGMGGVPEGGMFTGVGKVRAGNYRVTIRDMEGTNCTKVWVTDLDRARGAMFCYTTEENKSVVFRGGRFFNGAVSDFQWDAFNVSFKIGDFDSCINERSGSFILHGGQKGDSLDVTSSKEISVPLSKKLLGRQFLFRSTQKVSVDGVLDCSEAIFSDCNWVQINGTISVGYLFAYKTFMKNCGNILCHSLICYASLSCDDCTKVLSVKGGEAPAVDFYNVGSSADSAFYQKGLERDCWDRCNKCWHLPFFSAEDDAVLKDGFCGEQFLKLPKAGRYRCLLVLKFQETHPGKVSVLVKDACGSTLGSEEMDGVADVPALLVPIVLNVKNDNCKVSFSLQGKQQGENPPFNLVCDDETGVFVFSL